MELDLDELRPRYRLCRAGFGLMALALGLLCLDATIAIVLPFTRNQDLLWAVRSEWWKWLVGAPITWGSLAGSYLLWGRWKEPIWQKKAGALVLLNSLDLVTWGIHHAGDLGFKVAEIPHPYLMETLTGIFGWIELYLAASLAVDLILHLGHEPPDFARAAPSFLLVGLTVAILIFVTRTNWDAGWPLLERRMIHPLDLLLELARRLMLALSSFLVTGLCLSAAARSGEYLSELDRHAGREHEALRSRSESENDPFGP